MAKKLLSVCAIVICSACGLDDLDSASKFISKTQNDPTLTTGDKHRCYFSGGTRICGDHGNAYLINKVHVHDHPDPANRIDPYSNLTIAVNVGWYALPHADCNTDCSTTTTKGGITAPTTAATCTDTDPDPYVTQKLHMDIVLGHFQCRHRNKQRHQQVAHTPEHLSESSWRHS